MFNSSALGPFMTQTEIYLHYQYIDKYDYKNKYCIFNSSALGPFMTHSGVYVRYRHIY